MLHDTNKNQVITPIARFTTRLQGEGDGLFVGAVFRQGKDIFKPNTVYEIVDVMGDLTIREVGMASGAGEDNCVSNSMHEHKTFFHWAEDIGNIIAHNGKELFLTLKERIAYHEKLRAQRVDL